MASNNSHLRPALGQDAYLGDAYNAHRDVFEDVSFIRANYPPNAKTIEKNRTMTLQTSPSNNMQDRFKAFGVYPDLAASFITGSVQVRGAARYLVQAPPDEGVAEGFVLAEILTESISLDFSCPALREYIIKEPLRNRSNTHVVVGMTFGVQFIVCAQQTLADPVNTQEDMADKMEHIKSMIAQHLLNPRGSVGGKTQVNAEDNSKQPNLDSLTFAVLGDSVGMSILDRTKYSTVQKLIPTIPSILEKTKYGRGYPVAYTLAPLDYLRTMCGFQLARGVSMVQAPKWVLEQAILTWESLQRLSKTSSHLQDALGAKDKFMTDFGSALVDVRSGYRSEDSLAKLLDDHYQSSNSPDRVAQIISNVFNEIYLRKTLAIHGGQYLDYTTSQNVISTGIDIYIMFFTDQMKRDDTSWQESQEVITKLLARNPGDYSVAMAECESTEIPFSKPRILFYSRGEVKIPDMIRAMDFADQNFMKRDFKSTADDGHHPPRERRLVSLPCPCDENTLQEWACYHCRGVLEYHDKFFYCDCGHTSLNGTTWQCNDEAHGKTLVRWDIDELEDKLDSLHSYKEMNILLLGESGVGKSTFINSFYNHMMFESLDDAMEHEKLEYAVPSSFTIQYVDNGGSFVERDVKIGQDDEEREGSTGQSATQSPTVYRVQDGDRLIRLIDTPGIGDARGEKFDKINMDKILSTLNQFSSLHGILILVKPNNARLNVIFKFCVQELLTYLHRDAVRNICWGFTNTRQSNYMPGDSLKPLRLLLEKHHSLGLELTSDKVFCFDSESFRCLATQKQTGYTMDNLGDFRNSWNHSTKQTKALLDHVGSLEPHRVKSTMSVNRAREVITELTQPMADITDAIERTIRMNEDKIEELKSAEIDKKSLQQLLHFDRIEIEVERLDHPRTVCKDPSCVEYKDISGIQRPLYNSICHDPCHLTNVQEDVMGHPDMAKCAAFTTIGTRPNCCKRCGHHWQSHLHIRFSQTETVVEHTNEEVQKRLKGNRSDRKVKKSAIVGLEKEVDESNKTLEDLQDAAIRFGLYLKKKSIVPYNDAMIAYLDMLIKDEKEQINHAKSLKVDTKKNEEHLSALKKNKKRFEERIRILETQMAKSDEIVKLLDEEGVDDLVQKLFNLKHWGKNLQAMMEMMEWSRASGFREQELRPLITRSRTRQVARAAAGNGRITTMASLLSNKVADGTSAARGIAGRESQRTVVMVESSRSPVRTPTQAYQQDGGRQRSATLETGPTSSSTQSFGQRGIKRDFSQGRENHGFARTDHYSPSQKRTRKD
ncbi:hypothetical protein PG997_014233 [Apiospora hydei]|uniref:G domain-containing protein n=1 Tax=Apiospora hydei TaxID=1337664 RepID=A0ABR1UVN2_9PEZI